LGEKGKRVKGKGEKCEVYEPVAKVAHFVILNEVKDLNLLKIQDSSLRSE
jgi:hypothetical protein